MVAAAEASDRVLDVAFNYRERGDTTLLHDMTTRGRFGDISTRKRTGFAEQVSRARTGSRAATSRAAGHSSISAFTSSTWRCTSWASRAVRHRVRGDAHGVRKRPCKERSRTHVRRGGLGHGPHPPGRRHDAPARSAWASHADLTDEFSIELLGTKAGARLHIKDYATIDTLRVYEERGGIPTIARPLVWPGEGHLGVVRRFLAAIESGSWSERHGRVLPMTDLAAWHGISGLRELQTAGLVVFRMKLAQIGSPLDVRYGPDLGLPGRAWLDALRPRFGFRAAVFARSGCPRFRSMVLSRPRDAGSVFSSTHALAELRCPP